MSCPDTSPFASSPRLFFGVSFPAVQSRFFRISFSNASAEEKAEEEKKNRKRGEEGEKEKCFHLIFEKKQNASLDKEEERNHQIC